MHLRAVPARGGLVRLLRLATVVLAATYLISFLVVAGAHVLYPYEIDNLEGNHLAMSLRVLHGEPLYARPSVDYTPFCYPPLYFYASAAVMRAIGAGYAALRLVSLVATAATSSLVYAVLRRERVRPGLALIAVACFVGAYARTHGVDDAGRVDALALALAFGSLAITCSATPGWRSAAIAGVLGGLAILAKQPMAILIGAAAAHQIARGPRRVGLVLAATTAATVVGVLAAMGLLFDPWLTFYCLEVPASHHLRGWDLAVLGPVFVVTTVPIALFAPLVHDRSLRRWLADPWSAVTLAFLPMALVARAKEGGSANVFLPLVALAAVQLGRHAEHVIDRLPRVTLAACAVQLALLAWSPLAVWPTRDDLRRGDELVARLAAIPGDVYVPAFPAYAARAGKPWHAHYVALCDVARVDDHARAELARALAGHRFAAILPVMDIAPGDRDRCDLPATSAYHVASTIAIPPAPSDAAAITGGPHLFALVHGGKLGAVLR